MPGIVTGSLDVMSKTGTGMSMFSMGKTKTRPTSASLRDHLTN